MLTLKDSQKWKKRCTRLNWVNDRYERERERERRVVHSSLSRKLPWSAWRKLQERINTKTKTLNLSITIILLSTRIFKEETSCHLLRCFRLILLRQQSAKAQDDLYLILKKKKDDLASYITSRATFPFSHSIFCPLLPFSDNSLFSPKEQELSDRAQKLTWQQQWRIHRALQHAIFWFSKRHVVSTSSSNSSLGPSQCCRFSSPAHANPATATATIALLRRWHRRRLLPRTKKK